jgi:ubiquinone/menaquinone biosynthesis C-methylase UbiE
MNKNPETNAQPVCPWWLGYILVNPFRKIFNDPKRILSRYIIEGKKVLDVGSGMGYFTLPAAELVGEKGRVVAVDLQEKMLEGLRKRAVKRGFSGRIETRLARKDTLGMAEFKNTFDFALAFYMLHEVSDKSRLLCEIFDALKPGGMLFCAEPKGHVSLTAFEETLCLAAAGGFKVIGAPPLKFSHSALLIK